MDNARHEEERQTIEQAMTQIETQLASLTQAHGLLQRDHDRLATIEVSLQSRLEQMTVKQAETHAAYTRLEVIHAGCELSSDEMQKKYGVIQQVVEKNAQEMRHLESRYILLEQQLTETTKAALEDARAQIKLLAQEKWELG